jgi:hypothetical protein
MTISWNSFRSKLKGKGYTLEQLSKMYKKASKKTSKKASKKASKKGSKKASKKTSKKASKKGSKKASKKASKKTSKKPSKKTSKKASKKGSKKASKKSSQAPKASIQPSQAGKKPSKSQVKHTPVNHTGQIYRVHDNGGRPFLVVFPTSATVQIYKIPKKVRDNWDWDKESPKNEDYSELVKSYTIVKLFIGKSPKTGMFSKINKGYDSYFDGNSILLQLSSDRYVFIGWDIYEFTFPEQIVEYVSPVGNSDVPYPVAISTNYAIFMNDKVYLPKNEFPSHTNWQNPYVDFYALTMKNFDKNRKDKLLKPKKLKTKMIHKRID